MGSTRWQVARATLVLALVFCTPALGQRGFGRGRTAPALIQRAEVQAELKLSEEQKARAKETTEKLAEESRARFQDLQDASPEERLKVTAEVQAREIKQINALLADDQKQRFKQIYVQQQGEQIFAAAWVAEALKLTDEQKARVKALIAEQQVAIRAIFDNAGNDREATRVKLEALRQATNDKLAALLTDDQKAKWKEMQGPIFALTPAAL